MNSESETLPVLTIVTVCRNAANRIDATGKSLVGVPSDIEWLVVDGGSTDDTVARAQAWGGRLRAGVFRLISEPDQGIYDAMNKGLRLARGEWVLFLNAGDTLASTDALDHVLAMLAESGDLFTARVRLRDPTDGYEKNVGDALSAVGVSRGRLPPHQATFYRRETAVAAGGYEPAFGLAADAHLTLRIFERGSTRHVDQVVAVYPIDGVSSRFDWRWRMHRDKARAIKAAAPAWAWRRYRWLWLIEALRATTSHLLRRVGLLGVWRRIKGAR